MRNQDLAARAIRPRRRVLRLLAATSVAGLAAATGALMGGSSTENSALHRWQGKALGADSTLLIHHPDVAEANRLIRLALAEIARLEKIYSLKRPDSLLVKLNREHRLENPPSELVALLDRARSWSEISAGAFDITVQPLWELYQNYFSGPDSDPDGPPETQISKIRQLVDYRALDVEPECICLDRPDMAVTLNGIAQGDITDRVAELLRAEGLNNSLIDLGEMRALGAHPQQRPWRVGVWDPYAEDSLLTEINLNDRAIATSSVTGTVFDAAGQQHHLFNPESGRPSRGMISASVVARRAVDADACSTALLAARQPLAFESTVAMGIEQIFAIDNRGATINWRPGTS
jgi:thiamine biosynthesis lipoprotein